MQEANEVEALQYIEKLNDLPTLPTIATRVVSVTSDTDTSVKEVASLIEKDMALSAKILQVINSTFYSFSREIVSVPEAVSLMGFTQVGNLALGLSVVEGFPRGRIFGFSFPEFWERSVSNAVAAVMAASKLKTEVPGGIFTTALLQDIGTYVLVRYLPLAYGDSAGVSRERSVHRVHAERDVMGTDHAEVGALLSEKWNLPQAMRVAIRHHHFTEFSPKLDPEIPQNGEATMVKIINVSNLITDVLYEEDGEDRRPDLDQRVNEILGLRPNDVDEILGKLPEEIEGIKSLFQLHTMQESDVEETYHESCPKCGSGKSVKYCADCGGSLIRTGPEEAREARRKIVVAEDSEAIRTAIVSLLKKRGYKVLIAINGAEAVEITKDEQPDMVLMDIRMPIMDGIEALKILRRDVRLQSTPIVMLTSITDLNTVTEAIEAGANDYIAKPFKVSKLLESIEKYVHASAGPDPASEYNVN